MVPETSASSGVDPTEQSATMIKNLLGNFTLPTCILQYELDIKDGNNLALTLAHIHITIHALNLAYPGLDITVLRLELGQVVLKPLPCPRRDILVHPVPVVGVV